MGNLIIPIYVENEQDLYSRFDPSGLQLSSNLTEYLSDNLENRKIGERLTLEIHAENAPDMDG